jgi:hypothetical protein
MKLSTILEDAAAGAISAQAIAGNPFTHSSKKVRRRKFSGSAKIEKIKFNESSIATFDVGTAILFEFDDGQNAPVMTDKNKKIVADVNDKVSNATKRADVDDKTQTSTFGLQDGDGKIVKVTVKREQAEDFESRLNSILSDTEQKKEIAEVLYMLKQDYDIVDVEWDEPITEDDEEGMGGEEGGEDDLALDGEEGGEEGDLDLDAEGEGDLGGEDETSPDMQQSTVQLLQQVIDLLKSETGVRTANADVAKAKAETELQGVEQQKQDNEIASQQEIADMEDFEEEEKERKKNERLVQRLAKFRSQKSGGASRQ